MASIPLPALSVQAPQPNDPLASFQRLMALKSLANQQQLQQSQLQSQQQEQQLRQQQIADQQLVMGYLRQNPGHTYGDAADALKGQLSPTGYANAIDLDAKVTQAHSQATQSQLDVGQKVHDQQQRIYNSVKNLPPDELAAQTPQIAGQLNNIPGTQFKLDPSQPLTPDSLTQHGVMLGLQEAYLKQEQDKRKESAATAESEAKAGSETATAEAKRLESQYYQNHGGAPGVPVERVEMDDWLAKNKGKTPSDFLLWKAQHSPTMLMQGSFGQANDPLIDMVGQNRVDLATALQRVAPGAKDAFLRNLSAAYPNFNQGAFGVEKKATEAFTSGSQGQQLTAIDTARQHMQTFKDTADALHNQNFLLANKIGNAIGMQFGSDATTNFQIARAAFAGEVGKAFAGANVAEGDRRELLDKINAASSPDQLKGYADTADKLLEGKQTALKRSYESSQQAKPNFGTQSSAAAATKTYQGHVYEQQPDGSYKLKQ